jgi:cytosine/adenosine deaminase-related metal-dependent hydrolase
MNQPVTSVDTLLVGTVITCNEDHQVIGDGAVAVSRGQIVAVGQRSDIERSFSAGRTIGGSRCTVMPGLIDCHSHLSQALVRSLIAHELPMIQRLYLPAEDAMTLDDVATSVRLCVAQLLRSGITCVAETTATQAHEETILATLTEIGMRAIVSRGSSDQSCHHESIYGQVTGASSATIRPGDAEKDLAHTAAFLDRYDPSGASLIKGGVLASHLTGSSPHYVRLAAQLAEERGASFQVHVSRDREEIEFCLAVLGSRPLQALADLGVLGPRFLAIHGILLTDVEARILAETDGSLAHAPLECLNILSGVPPVARWRRAGVHVGLGCDNALNDGFEVMRAAMTQQGALRSIPGYDPEHLPAEDILDMATRDAARALSWDRHIGSLEVGKHADVVIVDRDSPHLMSQQHPVVDLVRYGTRNEVRWVLVNGEVLVDDRQLTTIDLEAVRRSAEEIAPRVSAVVTPRRYRALSPNVHLG